MTDLSPTAVAAARPGIDSAPARPGPDGPDTARIAREFEAVFLGQAVKQMFATVEMGEGGGGHAEEQWRGFLATAVADQIAAQGTTGIADQIADAIRARILADRAAGDAG